jgi:hypothetical protein
METKGQKTEIQNTKEKKNNMNVFGMRTTLQN